MQYHQQNPAMHRYAGNPLVQYALEHPSERVEKPEDHGPEQEQPLFFVPTRDGGMRPVVLNRRDHGVPVTFVRNDLDGFKNVFDRLAHGFPQKRPRPEACNHQACRLKQHVPEFGLPQETFAPPAEAERAWIQQQREAEAQRARLIAARQQQHVQNTRQEAVAAFQQLWVEALAKTTPLVVEAVASNDDEGVHALQFAVTFLKELHDIIHTPAEQKNALIAQAVSAFAEAVTARQAAKLSAIIEARKEIAAKIVLAWAKAAKEEEEKRHTEREAEAQKEAEEAARKFAEEWKQRRREQEIQQRLRERDLWAKKREEQQAAALRAQHEKERAERRRQLEEAAQQLLDEQAKELEKESEEKAKQTLAQKQKEEAESVKAEHEAELQRHAEELRLRAEQQQEEDLARQQAEAERVFALWQAAQEEREREAEELRALREQEVATAEAAESAECTCDIPETHSQSSHSSRPETPTPAGEAPAQPEPAQDPVEEGLTAIACIRRVANKAAAEWRDGAFVPIKEDRSNEKEVLHARRAFEEHLLQQVLHLDDVDSQGNLIVRQARKQAIKDIEDCVHTLKEYAAFYDFKPDLKSRAVLLADEQQA